MFFLRSGAVYRVRRLLCSFWFVILTVASGAAARAGGSRPGELLVRIQPWGDPEQMAALYSAQIIDRLPGTQVIRLRLRPGVDPEALSAILRTDPRVNWAEPNFELGLPEFEFSRWISIFDGGVIPGSFTDQPSLRQVDYGLSGQLCDGSGITVAVLDTGISPRHPYLSGRVVPGWNALNGSAQSDDAPNFLDDNANGLTDEGTGHGTMVAGVVALVAPRARLLPVKVLDSDGVGDAWSVVKGIRWALDQGAGVLNLSLGMMQYSALLAEAVDDAYRRGAVVVTSAGNDNTTQPQYPASLPRVLTVAALNPDNTKASFSNFGPMIDVCAPGVGICSTYWDGRFAVGTGTSFAAPFVAAQVALLRSASTNLDNNALQTIVTGTASNVDALNPLHRNRLGTGLIDVERALLSVLRS